MSRTLTHRPNRWGTVVLNTLLLTLLLTLIACADSTEPSPTPAPVVDRVTIFPSSHELEVGTALDLVSTAWDANNGEIFGLQTTWHSNRNDVATVSAAGRLQAVAVGTATITATIGGKSGTTAITVTQNQAGPIVRIAIEPGPLTLEEGVARTLQGVAYDAQNRVVPRTGFIWESSNSSVATITANGVLTALRPGTITVHAWLEQFTTTINVDVFAEWDFDLVYDELTVNGPELFALDLREPVAVPRLVLPAGTKASDPTPSPDGSKIAYVAIGQTTTAVYVANRDGSEPLRVSPAVGFADQPTWSPDGTQLALRYRRSTLFGTDIWVVSADGQAADNITDDMGETTYEREPSWSAAGPNGSRIAFVQASVNTSQIWSMRPDGVGKRRVTNVPDVRDGAPAWSPDGTKLAFTRNAKLWTVEESGANARPLISLGGTQMTPAWSPDGKLIAFASSHEAPALLYTVWSDGTRLARRSGQGDLLGNLAWWVR